MTNVSEAEVAAAEKVLFGIRWTGASSDIARAVLEAAAQVKGMKGPVAEERERCARIAETIDVPCNGHPQIDAPSITDVRQAIAAAIRSAAGIPATKDDVGNTDAIDVNSREAALWSENMHLKSENEALQDRLADQQAQWGYTESIQTLKIERLTATLVSLTKDLLATLDEPDTNVEVIEKMRAIARLALEPNLRKVDDTAYEHPYGCPCCGGPQS